MRNFLIYETLDDFYDVLYDKNDEKFKTFKSLGLINNYQYNISQVKYMNDFEHEYFTIMSVGEEPLVITGIIIDSHVNRDTLKSIEYSLDDGYTWHIRSNEDNKTENLNIISSPITLNYGERICLKGNAITYWYDGVDSLTFEFDQSYESKFEVSGNIMSLFYEDDFYHKNFTDDNSDCLSGFLDGQKMLVSAENLVLPSMFVPERGYECMFYGCRNLLYAPKVLPAKILSNRSYDEMFYGCKRLIKGPDIKALQPFRDMVFPGEAGIVTSHLPGVINPYIGRKGKRRWDDCFYEMFKGCSNLHYIGCDLTNLSYVYYVKSEFAFQPGQMAQYKIEEEPVLFTDCWCDNEYYKTETEDTSYYDDSTDPSLDSGYYNMFSKYGVFVKNRNAKYDNSQGISSIPEHWEIVYSDKKEYFFKPLTFKALEDSTIFYFTKKNTVSSDKLYYSLDEGKTWTECNFDNNVFNSPTLNNGDTISLKGNLTHPAMPQNQSSSYINGGIGSFKTNIVNNKYKKYDIYGNIESLVHNDEFIYGKGINFKTTQNNTEQYVEGLFFGIFKLPVILEDGGPVNAENLILGAMDLSDHCYEYMFQNCTALTTAPELLAIKMAKWCYAGMFKKCSNLVSCPDLPATTLSEWCYAEMFSECHSIVNTQSVLPATTLTNHCYYYMFNGCTSLTIAPVLPARKLADNCYNHMFDSCTSLTTAPALPATTLARYCYRHMFANCTSLTTAPELLATTLVYSCYSYMFIGCTSLTTAPELPATTIQEYYCYNGMFQNCSNLNYIKAMFTTTPSMNYTSNWVYGVAATGTFVKNANATWNVSGVNGIPSGWTVQTAAS